MTVQDHGPGGQGVYPDRREGVGPVDYPYRVPDPPTLLDRAGRMELVWPRPDDLPVWIAITPEALERLVAQVNDARAWEHPWEARPL